MKNYLFTFAVALAVAPLATNAVAQTRFCVGGDLDHLSVQQRSSCNAKLAAVKRAVATQGAPSDWHFVVVCDADGWNRYVEYAQSVSGGWLHTVSADTNVQMHETFLRGDAIRLEDPVALQETLSHELQGVRESGTVELTRAVE